MLALLFPLYSFFFHPWFFAHISRVQDGEIIPAFGWVCAGVVGLAIVARWMAPGAPEGDDDTLVLAALSWFLELFAITVVTGVALTAWNGAVNGWIAVPMIALIPLVIRLRQETVLVTLSSWLVSSCVFAVLFGDLSLGTDVWQMNMVHVVIASIFYVIALVSSFGLPVLLEWKSAPVRALFSYGLPLVMIIVTQW